MAERSAKHHPHERVMLRCRQSDFMKRYGPDRWQSHVKRNDHRAPARKGQQAGKRR